MTQNNDYGMILLRDLWLDICALGLGIRLEHHYKSMFNQLRSH